MEQKANEKRKIDLGQETFGAALQIWGVVQQYKMHDVTGWPMPSAWVLPWLTFGCIGTCVVTASLWITYLYRPYPRA